MAELASGAVTSLLGVIRNEWRLLGRVGGDVQFIQEEMESMNSFLMHLARTAPPGSEHDEQVRTWMNQVRVLAQDCNNCIDLYLYRGNPDIHLGSDRLRRYLRWVPWFLQKMWAQHRAALELSDLKERARDVGQRRLRYGVEVPKKTAAEEGSSEPAFVQFDGEEDGHETDASERIRRALFGLYVREDYFNDLLGEWIKEVRAQWSPLGSQGRHDTRCVAFVVPSTESGAIARQALAVGEKHVSNTILVDIPSLHYWYALGPKNILYYILREIQLQQTAKSQIQQQQGQGTGEGEVDDDIEWERTEPIRQEKRKVINEIKENIRKLKVVDRIQEITAYIEKAKDDEKVKKLQPYLTRPRTKHITKDKINRDNHDLGVLLVLLLRSSVAAATADETEPTLAEHYDDILKKTAEKLREHMEQVNTRAFTGATATGPQIIHSVTQYAQILQDVFQKNSSPSKNQQAQEQGNKQATTEATPGKNQIREIIDNVKQEILSEVLMAMGDKGQEATKTVSATTTLGEAQVKKMIQEAMQQLKEEKPADKKQETGVPGGQGPTTEAPTEEPNKEKGRPATGSNPAQGEVNEIMEKTREILDAAIKVTTKKMKYNVQWRIERQLDINGIVAKIQNHLKREETLIILKVDEKYVSEWEQTRNALSLLPCIAVVMILTKTETNLKVAKQEYCYPKGEEPKDYSSLAALYHGIVLKITSQQNNEYNNDAQILRTILDKCEPNELCMKIFAHALYAKPKRSNEELHRLHNSLQAVLPQNSYRSIAMKMFNFSYRDMPKDYQSCLLYLAIFPRGHKIRRSTLIGRWVAEGMITTEDWRWSSSVQRAEQCFDAFVTRGLVYSAEAGISATRRVKSCMVGDLVHEFITEIAKKQRIVEARLSHHLARHFSIFNDLHLRGSDQIDAFLKSSSESSQWSRLKVLDLESCKCFMENRRYLKNICNNIFLLKYLSLRRTDVNWLPPEINNLRELEVLDIQETEVPENFTRNLLLLKLKRLLAGNKNPSPNSTKHHVLVPEKIEKMLNMEVLSNVKAKSNQDLDGITKLWQLRKLGVVVEISHLTKLLQAISDLHECLQTLSITLDTTRSKKWRELEHPPKDNKTEKEIKDSSKVERLSISGNIPEKLLLQFLDVGNPLIKVTLSNTSLSQEILNALSQLSRLNCLKLRHNTYSHNKLTFKKGEFEKLKYFLVEGSNRIEVSFEEEAAKELEKIVLSFDSVQSITGVDHLPKLEELEINNNIKSSSSSGGITALPQPATPPPPPTTTTAIANDPVLSTTTATDAAHSTPITAAAAIPSSSAPAATAVANDPIPSTATTTDTAPTTSNIVTTIPSPSAATATAAANDPVLSTATTTNPTPYVPATTAIPSPSTPVATAASDTIPSTATATTIPTPSLPTTSNNNNILFLKLLYDAKQITKVTLRCTMLKQDDIRSLARVENIRCMVLSHESYGESQLNFNKGEFPKLNLLIVNCCTITNIKFDHGSAPKLEKIVWTFNQNTYLSGIENLPRLKEVEFTGKSLPIQVKEGIDKHKDRIHCIHYKPESQDQTVRSTVKEDSVPSCLHIWKDKGWCGRKN